MKPCVILYFISLISLNGLSHAGYIQKRFKRTDETSTQLGLGSNEKESLQEALEILNLGKHSLNLPTEDTQLLLQLADVSSNDTDKSDQIEKFVEGPSDDHFSSNGKKYLALSGDNGQVKVNNFSFVTPGQEETSTNDNVEIQDVFKMVVRKKVPGSKDNAVHKISIVETNRVEPLTKMKYPQSKRKRDTRFLINSLDIPRERKKRTNSDPLIRFIRGDFSAKDIDEIFADKDTSGPHSIKIRNLLEKDKFRGNNRIWKRKFDGDNKRHDRIDFQETAPWMSTHYRSEFLPEKGFRRDFFLRRDANKHRKFRTPLKDLQSSNWQVWRHPLKLKSWLDDEYVDGVLKTSHFGKAIDIDKALSYEGLSHYFVTTKAYIFSRNRTTRAHPSKHSFIKKIISSTSPNPNSSSQSNMTESGTTLQHEKIVPNQDIAINKYAFEKSAIFPSESSIKETNSVSISEVAIVVFIGFLCLATFFLVFSIAVRCHPQKTCCSTLDLKGAQVTVHINDSSSDGTHHRLPFKSHSELYYRKMAVQEDEESDFCLPDFEWQSEVGEWLSDQGSVRQAIAFEEL